MPRVGRIIESSLYVDRLEVAAAFYERIFGFLKLQNDERLCAFSVSDQQVLLIFQKSATQQPIKISGGVIPPHDGSGQLHLAFTIAGEDEQRWTEHLARNGIPIESRVMWPRGGSSIYFRDPDGHLLELITPGCWTIY